MSGTSTILNADMATLGGWLRNGWRWWRDELGAMIPPAWRSSRRGNGPLAFYHGDGGIEMLRGEAGSIERPRVVDLALPVSIALMRSMDLPAMSKADLRSYIALESERLFPLAGNDLLIDAEPRARTPGAMTMPVRIAALRREDAEAALAAARDGGISPRRITLLDPAVPDDAGFDFAPQLRAEGLLPPQSQQALLWWSLVGFAFLFNIGLLIWRDQQSVARLQAAIEAQAPAVSVYRAIAGRTAHVEQAARITIARRRTHDALGDLAAATAALPDSAWVQRYDWDGRSLRLAGYLRPPTDVVAALGKSGRFIDVRPSNADIQADIPIGQPFDISATIAGGAQ